MEQISDEVLFEQYRTGDHAAFRTLIERHHVDLIRFLTRLLGDSAGAEDVFQETFVQIHLSAGTFDPTRRFRPWLFTIAANKARDSLRKRGRRRTLDLSAPVDGVGGDGSAGTFVDLLEIDTPPPSAGMESQETSRQVQEVLDGMPPILREILLLAYFQRLSYAQVADELEIPLGTVKSRLHAAVAAFAKRWKERVKENGNGDGGSGGRSALTG